MLQEKEKQLVLQEKDSHYQLQRMQWQMEKERINLHYRYTFQNDSAKRLGRAAIEQYVQRRIEQEQRQLVRTDITNNYRLLHNMDKQDPFKVNNLGIVFNKTTNEYSIIRQQWATTLNTYDYIQKTAESAVVRLDPTRQKCNLNTDMVIIGEMIPVAYGANIWTSFIRSKNPLLFGVVFKQVVTIQDIEQRRSAQPISLFL